MAIRSKRYKADTGKVSQDAVSLTEAVATIKKLATTKFDQTVELILHLGIDPKQADQMLRGSLSLPKGIGKTKRVIAFCEGPDADAAREAGATEVGADELVSKIQGGWSDFDVAVAHPSLMGKVGKLGRVLGPQGKMPSPKSGTVTPDVATAVKEYGAGKIEYRNDDGGNLHAGVGKVSFSEGDLTENIEAFIEHVKKIRPTAAKGQYIKRATLKGTMTPAVFLAVG